MMLVLITMASSCLLLSPPVGMLPAGPIMVTRWDRHHGKILVPVGPTQPGWLKLEKISYHTINAILTAEDARFYSHFGIDLREIVISFAENWHQGRYVRGASTITQQVVKLLFLDNDKTLWRKAREICGALLVELRLDKNTIVEWYLNLVDFGSGVYGIDQAAHYYFDTPPELLSIPQSILLASVVPSPNRWAHSLRSKELTPVGHQRFISILTRMRSEGFINRQQCRIALRTGNFGSPIHGETDGACD